MRLATRVPFPESVFLLKRAGGVSVSGASTREPVLETGAGFRESAPVDPGWRNVPLAPTRRSGPGGARRVWRVESSSFHSTGGRGCARGCSPCVVLPPESEVRPWSRRSSGRAAGEGWLEEFKANQSAQRVSDAVHRLDLEFIEESKDLTGKFTDGAVSGAR